MKCKKCCCDRDYSHFTHCSTCSLELLVESKWRSTQRQVRSRQRPVYPCAIGRGASPPHRHRRSTELSTSPDSRDLCGLGRIVLLGHCCRVVGEFEDGVRCNDSSKGCTAMAILPRGRRRPSPAVPSSSACA